jgi:hypothetical protein
VEREIELAEAPTDLREQRLHLARDLDIERQEDRRLELLRERLDVGSRLVVQVGERELAAEGAEGAGAAVRDRVLVGDTDHEALLALEAAEIGIERHGSLGRGHQPAPAMGARPSTESVWRAIICSSSVGIA